MAANKIVDTGSVDAARGRSAGIKLIELDHIANACLILIQYTAYQTCSRAIQLRFERGGSGKLGAILAQYQEGALRARGHHDRVGSGFSRRGID